MEAKNPVITTFYSYKGGVGRSMALANVAWVLATKYEKKVLVVDWDLEAPGLHRFFGIEQRDIIAGCIDMFDDYKQIMKAEGASLPEPLINLEKYVIQVPLGTSSQKGSISLIAAGRQDEEYARRVNEFDWDEFYQKWHGYGFIEYLRNEFKKNVDLVLLDSRTGVTDIGGICTLHLPDIVVLLFSLNEQSIAGTEFVAENILRKAVEFSERQNPPTIIIRPARVEKFLEQDKKNQWERKAALRLRKYLLSEDREEAVRFIKQNGIPYVGAYSFGETPLAAQKNQYDEPSVSFDALAVSILKVSQMWDDSLAPRAERRTQTPDTRQAIRRRGKDYSDRSRRSYYVRFRRRLRRGLLPLAMLVNLGSVALSIVLHATFDTLTKVLAGGSSLVLLAFLDLSLSQIKERRKAQLARDEWLFDLLRAATESILQVSNPPVDRLRASILVPNEERSVLRIAYSYNYQPEDRDSQIVIPIGAGCAGQAWVRQTAVIADLGEMDAARMPMQWGLTDSEVEKIRPSTKSILCIPIQVEDRTIGVLSFDSENSMHEIQFADRHVQDLAYSFSATIGSALSADDADV